MFHVELTYDISIFMGYPCTHCTDILVCALHKGLVCVHMHTNSDVMSRPNMKQSVDIAIIEFTKLYCAIMSYVAATYKLFLYVNRQGLFITSNTPLCCVVFN